MRITIFPIILCFAFILNLISCKQKKNLQETISTTTVSADSLIGLWNDAWNNHDSTALANTFTSKSIVVFSDKESINGKDSIMIKWINNNLPAVKNLKTEKITSSSNTDMAYYAGTYSLDISAGDSTRSKDLGCFNAVWKLQNDHSWKIELMFFGVHAD